MKPSINMKPSLYAHDHLRAGTAGFMTLDEMSMAVRDQNLYRSDGHSRSLQGLVGLTEMRSIERIERQINELTVQMRDGEMELERDYAQHRALDLASTSTDPYELNYLGMMQLENRAVLRRLAKNRNLPEKLQLVMINDESIVKDKEILLNLAHNPNVSPSILEKIIKISDNPFILQSAVNNAVARSLACSGKQAGNPFADICNRMAMSNDSVLSKRAIEGATDPNVLRDLVTKNDVILGAGRLSAVAGNIHTPVDVLEKLSNTSFASLQSMIGVDVAARAKQNLHQRQVRDRNTNDGPSIFG